MGRGTDTARRIMCVLLIQFSSFMIDLHKEALLSDDNVVLQAILSGPSAKQPSDRCLLFLDELF